MSEAPSGEALDAEVLRPRFPRWLVPDPAPTFWLTREALVRSLAFIYFVAFISLALQVRALIGRDGLEPARVFLEEELAGAAGSRLTGFWHVPTIFWLDASDPTLVACAWLGAILSLAVLAGLTNALAQLVLWALYLSFVHIGQTFYGYGWESLLCEAGFLAILLCPFRTVRPMPTLRPSFTLVYLYRWLTCRLMLGAGLIKLRGDECWRDLTCLVYHYETQPNPHPLSWVWHQLPPWMHSVGVLFNYLAELIAPFLVLGPRWARHTGGAIIVAFQVALILSGNLSFLNWLTIAVALSCFDDAWLAKVVPKRMRKRVEKRESSAPKRPLSWRIAVGVLASAVGLLSIDPIANMLSPHQQMNTSFDRFLLVNTYGAFGSVSRERDEVVILGTDAEVLGPTTRWREYEIPCKPGDPMRRPCLVTPFQYRLEWQMWFAGLSDFAHEPWIVHLVSKLLEGDPLVKTLLERDPFPNRPPRWVRLDLYRYRFTRIGDGNPGWWTRERLGTYLPPLSRQSPAMHEFLAQYGWDD